MAKETNSFYVYMFLDINENPVYIGRTINLATRIETQHFTSENGNLSKDCIDETDKILYHKSVSEDDMKIKERYLINTLNPKYNKQLNNNSRFSFSIDFDWKLYSIDKVKLIEKQKQRSKKSRLVNHQCEIIKPCNSSLEYGIEKKKEEKNNYLKIRLPNKILDIYVRVAHDIPHLKESEIRSGIYDIYLILINNELYVASNYFLSYYTAHYKEFTEKYNLNKETGFLTVLSHDDKKLSDFSDEDFKSEYGVPASGRNYIKYDVVKKHNFLNDDIIDYINKKITKISISK